MAETLRRLTLAAICLAASGCTLGPSREERVLRVGTFSTYACPELGEKFEAEFKIPVEIHTYTSNEELISKVVAKAIDFDVMTVSDYAVAAMIRQGLLAPLDAEDRRELEAIDRRHLGKRFDPKNEYSVPAAWGTTGIATNLGMRRKPVQSWRELFTEPDLKNRFSMLDDMRETIGAALKYRGKGLNASDDASLAEAEKTLGEVFARARMVKSLVGPLLASGELVAAHIYSNDAEQANEKSGGKIAYVVPREGGTIWLDNFVIARDSEKREQIHAWLRYMLNPATSEVFASHAKVGQVVRGAGKTALRPPENPKLEEIIDLQDKTQKYERIWKRLSSFFGS